MTTLTYAGIGARATPFSVLADMTVMAGWLARTGWHLATGGADGADTAFAAGAPTGRERSGCRGADTTGHAGPDCRVLSPSELDACMDLAARLIPPGTAVRQAVRKLHARNAVDPAFGDRLDRPVDAVGAGPATPGAVTGGTGMGIRIAEAHGIPVLNLGAMSPRTACERLAAIRRAAAAS